MPIELFSIEFWVAFQLVIDLVLIALILYASNTLKSGVRKEVSQQVTRQVLEMIEPLLKEAKTSAETFDQQLKEKRSLINQLNENLDSRIISLNLLLNRAETCIENLSRKPDPPAPPDDPPPREQHHVYDQQEAVFRYFQKGYDSRAIAEKLGMPIGEVELVIDLRKKFMQVK